MVYLRSLVYNAIIGVTKGYIIICFYKVLVIESSLKGNDLRVSLGYSHPVFLKHLMVLNLLFNGQDKFKLHQSINN